MIDCPRCGSPVDGMRCRCGEVITPVQESFPDRGVPAPEKRARIHDMVKTSFASLPAGELRRDPVEHWKEVLNRQGLPEISYRYAREALAVIDRPGRERPRQPGDDDDEAFV